MLHQTSKKFRAFFLLQFTRELIKHSGANDLFELQNILKEEDKEKKQEIKREKEEIHQIITGKRKLEPKRENKILFKKPLIMKRKPLLRIPEPKLPPQLQYLKPTPTNIQIDLEKLNPLIKDPAVKIIECNGPDENLLVKGVMGAKKTNIILNKEEINQIIKKFSETAKIPLHEGIFRVAVGKLILLAIISEVVDTKFIIKKIMYAPREIFRR